MWTPPQADRQSWLDNHNLANRVTYLAENDAYVPCAGAVVMKCFKASQKLWEAHANDLRNFNAFIGCYEKQTSSCDFPIARKMNTLVQALAKHMKEKGGLFGGMLEEIKP